eukprot:gene11509-24066_t
MSENDEDVCPLCVEELDLVDKNFLPCPCGYRVCMWCWHHIKESLSGLCPGCRAPYKTDPHAFSAVDRNEIVKKNKERKQKEKNERKDVDRPVAKAPPTDRKHLHNYRVIQRNLVYIIGVPVPLASEELLRSPEYFGQYGKIGKIVIHKNSNSAHPTVSAYVTFYYKEDARAAIAALEGFWLDGHHLRASFGTTKYCNNFIRGVPCNNPECVYLHELGEDEDRFTKEEIQAGHSKLVQLAGKDQSVVTGAGGPSGTGKRVVGEGVLPPPVFVQDNIEIQNRMRNMGSWPPPNGKESPPESPPGYKISTNSSPFSSPPTPDKSLLPHHNHMNDDSIPIQNLPPSDNNFSYRKLSNSSIGDILSTSSLITSNNNNDSIIGSGSEKICSSSLQTSPTMKPMTTTNMSMSLSSSLPLPSSKTSFSSIASASLKDGIHSISNIINTNTTNNTAISTLSKDAVLPLPTPSPLPLPAISMTRLEKSQEAVRSHTINTSSSTTTTSTSEKTEKSIKEKVPIKIEKTVEKSTTNNLFIISDINKSNGTSNSSSNIQSNSEKLNNQMSSLVDSAVAHVLEPQVQLQQKEESKQNTSTPEAIVGLLQPSQNGRSEALQLQAAAASFNGLGKCAVFPVPISSLSTSIWATILQSSSTDLGINPFALINIPLIELLELTLPPVDAVCIQPWPKPFAYYKQGLGPSGQTHGPPSQHIYRQNISNQQHKQQYIEQQHRQQLQYQLLQQQQQQQSQSQGIQPHQTNNSNASNISVLQQIFPSVNLSFGVNSSSSSSSSSSLSRSSNGNNQNTNTIGQNQNQLGIRSIPRRKRSQLPEAVTFDVFIA